MAPPQKQNCFMAFVHHWRKNHPNITIPQAVSHCSGIWENMTLQERKPFGGRYNKLQPTHAAAEKAQRELAEREQYMRSTTERIVMEGRKSQDLENIKFLFCAFNYFAEDPDDHVHVPAEFAACEYSLREGIISVFSTLIDPGQLNLGLSRNALEHSMTTHNLPVPPKALGEGNLVKLHNQMMRYLSKFHGRRPAIVFTTTDMMPIVESCFRFLASYGHEDFMLKILVFDIQYLFLVLKKAVLEMVGLPIDKINIHITDAFFLKDFFEFTKDIACDFHEENDRAKYCVQSMVMRWAFTFSDYMCGDLDITIVPGKHVPSTAKINYRIHTANTWSVTLAAGSSVDSFHSLPSFQGLRIGEANKSRRLRNDMSAMSSEFSTATDHDGFEEEDDEDDHQRGRRPRNISPISSRFSMSCAPYVATIDRSRQDRHQRSPSVDSQRQDDISSINSRRSNESFPYEVTDQKYPSKTKSTAYGVNDQSDFEEEEEEEEEEDKYERKGGRRLEEMSPNCSRRSRESRSYGATTEKRSSKVKKYRRQDEHYHNSSVDLHRRFPKEFQDDFSPNNSRRSSESFPYADSAQIGSSSKAKEYERQGEYHRNPSGSQRRSSKELQGNITPINNQHRYEANDRNGFEEDNDYERQDGRRKEQFWDDIASNNNRRSSAFVPYGDMTQKRTSKDKEYSHQGGHYRNPSPKGFPDDNSTMNRCRSRESKTKEYPRQGGYQRSPPQSQRRSPINFLDEIRRRSIESIQRQSESYRKASSSQRRSSKEFSGNITPMDNHRSNAYVSYGAPEPTGSEEDDEYKRQDARRREEFWDNNSPFNSRSSSAFTPFEATDQQRAAKIEKYPNRGNPKYSVEREEPAYPRRFVNKLPDQPFDYDFDD